MNAQAIITCLKERGWSDAAIARAIGRSQPTITRIRRGASDPRESLVRALATLYAREIQPSPTPSPNERPPVVVFPAARLPP